MGQEEAGKSHFIALLVNGQRAPSPLFPILALCSLVGGGTGDYQYVKCF